MTENSIKKHTLYVMGGVAALLLLWASFGSGGDKGFASVDPETAAESPSDAMREVATPLQVASLSVGSDGDDERLLSSRGEVASILASHRQARALNRYEAHFDSMPPGGIKMKVNYLGGTLGRVFNDSNYLHISTAEKVGIKPLSGIREAWEAGARLERLQSCREYYLDDLTHSLPYLVPRAHRLLSDIGAAFNDSLNARGGGDYRIKVTSVLRTPRLVKRLRRRNRNAVDTSAHLFGTTFDISYAKFICDSTDVPRTQEDLKNLLGEVVFAMRESGRCYVKYERKQACFHITAR